MLLGGSVSGWRLVASEFLSASRLDQLSVFWTFALLLFILESFSAVSEIERHVFLKAS